MLLKNGVTFECINKQYTHVPIIYIHLIYWFWGSKTVLFLSASTDLQPISRNTYVNHNPSNNIH